MGDRATIHFGTSVEHIDAAIYLHWGGSDVPELLGAFFDEENAYFGDNRYDDAPTLAARFLAWHTANGDGEPRIVQPRSMDGADYLVTCDGDEVPTVTRLDP